MTVYCVYSDSHGLEGIYATEEGARSAVEHISVVDYGYRSDEEIGMKTTPTATSLCITKRKR